MFFSRFCNAFTTSDIFLLDWQLLFWSPGVTHFASFMFSYVIRYFFISYRVSDFIDSDLDIFQLFLLVYVSSFRAFLTAKHPWNSNLATGFVDMNSAVASKSVVQNIFVIWNMCCRSPLKCIEHVCNSFSIFNMTNNKWRAVISSILKSFLFLCRFRWIFFEMILQSVNTSLK